MDINDERLSKVPLKRSYSKLLIYDNARIGYRNGNGIKYIDRLIAGKIEIKNKHYLIGVSLNDLHNNGSMPFSLYNLEEIVSYKTFTKK